jgi:nitric oxide dioxygenase
MTPDAIAQIKRSHAAIAATPRQLSARFYTELFTRAPGLRRLFPDDLTALQDHFEAALALVIRNLDEMEALAESLRDLGAQHVHWGARPEDYATARDALVAAIGALSPDWSPSLESEWRAAITAIVVPMLQGAAVHTAVVAEQIASEGSGQSQTN